MSVHLIPKDPEGNIDTSHDISCSSHPELLQPIGDQLLDEPVARSPPSKDPIAPEPALQSQGAAETAPFLDMLSADMDFEQAYSMYTTLQHKHAINSVELLEKVQYLNHQYVSTLDAQQSLQQAGQQAAQHAPKEPQPGFNDVNFGYGNNTTNNNNNNNYFFGVNQPLLGIDGESSSDPANANPAYNAHRTQIISAGLMNNIDNKNYSLTNDKIPKKDSEDDDYDQFFSNTESNALETFLDSLANPVSSNPLQLYNKHPAGMSTGTPSNEFNDLFDLHTMKGAIPPSLNNFQFQKSHSMSMEHETLKKELTEAFSHTQLSTLSNTGRKSTSGSMSPQNQLPTPLELRESSSSFLFHNMKRKSSNLITPPSQDSDQFKIKRYRADYDELSGDETEAKKRRRSSTKPLLSLEQKRLNHSHSEQKRRQMCKLAYERCLRLIIDIEAFNKLPKESIDTSQRKSKRARVNKEGFPNLSKHSALIRISNEIMLVQDMNHSLKELLHKAGASRDVHMFEKSSAANLKARGNETNAALR